MISKNKIKLIRSLETRKGREKTGLFVAEGPKTVRDLREAGFRMEEAFDDPDDVSRLSFLKHPQGLLATFRIPQRGQDPAAAFPTAGLSIALDGVQDPGNLGTIIRTADWFGIRHIYCSRETADCWSPKVVQATMGSIARVSIVYTDLQDLAASLPDRYPVYATLLDGSSIYTEELTPNGLILMGNEGSGISPQLRKTANRRLLIPNFAQGGSTPDSLNVAVATAIVCSEFRRRTPR
ncbi:TrmH family RNA methyltransferase [Prevotella dentasini]